MVLKKIREFYQNTYKHLSFRDMMNTTRISVLLMDTLLIAFLANLYISAYLNEMTFIVLMILSTIYLYLIIFKYVYRQFHKYAQTKVVELNTKSFSLYLVIEAIVFSSLLIFIYFHIKSLYI